MRTPIFAGMLLASLLATPQAFTATQPVPGVEAIDAVEIETLVFMREEEKLARDVYATLHERWNANVFQNIADSEQRHMDAVATLLARYSIDDPVVDGSVGAFTNPDLAAAYTALVARGETSLLEAMNVGGYIEELDIRDLRVAIAGTDEAEIQAVYENLLQGSTQHLRAFVSHVEALGVAYLAQVLEQADVDALVAGASVLTQTADGSWMVTGHSGEGMVFDVTADGTFVMYWFTYDTEGNPFWMGGIAPLAAGDAIVVDLYSYHGPVFGSAYDPAALAEEPWGQATVEFHDCTHGTVAWMSAGGVGEYAIERLYFTGGSTCDLD